jgi:hypothetical protein
MRSKDNTKIIEYTMNMKRIPPKERENVCCGGCLVLVLGSLSEEQVENNKNQMYAISV